MTSFEYRAQFPSATQCGSLNWLCADTTYTVSGARDHYKQQGQAGFVLQKLPEHNNLFSELKHYPNSTFRLVLQKCAPCLPCIDTPCKYMPAVLLLPIAGYRQIQTSRRPWIDLFTHTNTYHSCLSGRAAHSRSMVSTCINSAVDLCSQLDPASSCSCDSHLSSLSSRLLFLNQSLPQKTQARASRGCGTVQHVKAQVHCNTSVVFLMTLIKR